MEGGREGKTEGEKEGSREGGTVREKNQEREIERDQVLVVIVPSHHHRLQGDRGPVREEEQTAAEVPSKAFFKLPILIMDRRDGVEEEREGEREGGREGREVSHIEVPYCHQ